MKRMTMAAALMSLLFIFGQTGTGSAVFTPDPGFDPMMTGVLLSGPTESVPWETDQEFIEAVKVNSCPILMAAFKTVLKDPLPGEEANVHLAASYINGTVVQPGGIFSQNRTAGPYTTDRGYRIGPTYIGTTYAETIGGGVCKVASTLYNVAVLSDLTIVERYHHGMPVPYVPYGQDATVSYGAKDFRFKNTTESPLLVMARGVDNILYIGFYGQTVPPKVVWSHDVLNVVKAPVHYQQNDALTAGTEKVVHEGMDGATISSWITRIYPDGSSDIRDMGERVYKPLPWTVEVNKKQSGP